MPLGSKEPRMTLKAQESLQANGPPHGSHHTESPLQNRTSAWRSNSETESHVAQAGFKSTSSCFRLPGVDDRHVPSSWCQSFSSLDIKILLHMQMSLLLSRSLGQLVGAAVGRGAWICLEIPVALTWSSNALLSLLVAWTGRAGWKEKAPTWSGRQDGEPGILPVSCLRLDSILAACGCNYQTAGCGQFAFWAEKLLLCLCDFYQL